MKKKRYQYFLLILCCVSSFILGGFFFETSERIPLTAANVRQAQALIGLEFSPVEIDSMLTGLEEQRTSYEKLRAIPLPNDVAPALVFNPMPTGFQLEQNRKPFRASDPGKVTLPKNREDLAFYSVNQLAYLLRTRQITSLELTTFFLERLKTYGPKLECTITLTEELALKQARKADEEIRAGKYRGLLHGIPYGAKDLLAVKGYKTTWGAAPYKDQIIDADATVIQKLEASGAVLLAKLTLGALAMGDVWFGGVTRNPWDLKRGSSGSSAGSASAVAAGLMPFAIGTETLGSIVSPSSECGTTGLRPTFGQVSLSGAMALAWSMDKIGPITRDVEDCAIVFNAIYGPDGKDLSVVDAPFNYDGNRKLSGIRVGYLKKAFEKDYPTKANDEATLQKLKELGVNLIALDLPDLPASDLSFIIDVESAAAFDELTRSNRDDLLTRQSKNDWANIFRVARFIPAVEYLQANRHRSRLIEEMNWRMKDVDVYVSPSFGGSNLVVTNLTGHPCVVLPNGFKSTRAPGSITFVGQLFGEDKLLTVARAYQQATDFHRKHPTL
jgi:Asp-tRNA(Asn)/Glu-tRNA(Gln) amidotransferase A subunit family amidase